MPPIETRHRPKRALLSVMLPLFVLVASCGSDSDASSAATQASTDASSSKAEASQDSESVEATPTTAKPTTTGVPEVLTKDIAHEVGVTEIDGVPERVVVLEYSFIDNLGALDIAPVGYALDAMPAYLLPYSEGVGAVAVGKRAEPDLEAIVALEPDLIIGDLRRHEEIYDQLSAIAPTLIFNSLRGSYQDQLDTFEVIAGVFDQDDAAATLMASHEERFEAAGAATNPDAGAFTVGVLWAEGYTAHSNESFMGSFLEGLGRTNALSPQGEETQYLLDLEGIAAAKPSSIVILCALDDQPLLDDLAAEPLWQALDAVKGEHVYVFERNLWSKGRGLLAYEQIIADATDSGLLAETASSSVTCG